MAFTLAGLAYRGFHDFLPGEPHAVVVRRAVLDGLRRLAPVKGGWELAWGPVTARMPLAVFDSSAMYVAREAGARHRLVVAVRGTNPVASSDWLFGDFLVGTTVRWPWATDEAAVSTSTALGLAMLQDMRARPPSVVARFAEASLDAVGAALDERIHSGRARLAGTTEAQASAPSSIEALVERVVEDWSLSDAARDIRDRLGAATAVRVAPDDLRQRVLPGDARGAGLDLLSFLQAESEAAARPLEVAVTGHSKGGALAQAVALWLADARRAPDAAEHWDAAGRARITVHAFAAPTPGNAAFAARLAKTLGDGLHQLRNTNDLVTHAWQADDLREIPAVYGSRTAKLGRLVARVVEAVEGLDYRHAPGAVTFAGSLDATRLLPAELVHQHLDAYADHLDLRRHGIDAITFFIR